MNLAPEIVQRLRQAINRDRLIETVTSLVGAPSPTGEAGPAADCLAAMLSADGFSVERPEAGHAASPAGVVRVDSGRPGRTLQFNGHLDVVCLPYAPPRVERERITCSGSCDMTGGVATAVEALCAFNERSA